LKTALSAAASKNNWVTAIFLIWIFNQTTTSLNNRYSVNIKTLQPPLKAAYFLPATGFISLPFRCTIAIAALPISFYDRPYSQFRRYKSTTIIKLLKHPDL
jgi:hypothetical protein